MLRARLARLVAGSRTRLARLSGNVRSRLAGLRARVTIDREKRDALLSVLAYDPVLVGAILVLSFSAALLEGIGVSFVLPIVEYAANGGAGVPDEGGRLMGLFVGAYSTLGVPFELEYLLAGLAVVMGVRHGTSVCSRWLQARIGANYVRSLKRETFERALHARVPHLDERGSRELVNAVVTQTNYPARVLALSVRLVEEVLVVAVYLAIALYLAPLLTVLAAVALGGVTVLVRFVVEPAYATGDRLAAANERIQSTTQSTIQGARTVKAHTMYEAVTDAFGSAVDGFAEARVVLARNEAVIDRLHRFLGALVIFGLIYLALTASSLTLGSLGVFLFAMFRLAPRLSRVNGIAYGIAGGLPHLVRTRELVAELAENEEPVAGDLPPERIDEVAFDGVTYAYEDGTLAAVDVSFEARRGEFVALVGPSGAGKSTLVALLARFVEPDAGAVRANGRRIDEFDLQAWRRRVSVVRQEPYHFDDTLRYNVAVGRPDASREAVERACEIARVAEFVSELPAGYDTRLGDDGVRLSGGQRQRVAIARALLEEPAVLVLDEATSDVDAGTEAEILEGIEEVAGERIVVAVAHRLSAIADADRVYAVEDGRITAAGGHEQLAAESSTYARLFSSQSRT